MENSFKGHSLNNYPQFQSTHFFRKSGCFYVLWITFFIINDILRFFYFRYVDK